MKLKFFLPLLLSLAFIACDKETNNSQEMYLGGLIVNPTSDFVVLLKKDVVVDTFYLDESNYFGGNVKTSQKGLYVFKHPPENQIMYMEPGDSTLIFLNTLAFDESLTFSGKGAEKSNYLKNMYLLNQENNDLIISCYKLQPSEFAAKTDSIRESRIQELKKLNKKNSFSEEFNTLANASIDYEYYDLRERYGYLIHKYSREEVKNIPEDFHSYRDDISFNDVEMEDSYVYLNLIDDYIRTKSFENCYTEPTENAWCYSLTDPDNISRRIRFADSLLQNQRIKNTFIDRFAAQGIIYSKNLEEIASILELLNEIEYSGDRIQDFRQMAGIQKALLPGNNLGKLKLLNTQNYTVQLKNISRRPKITYHWSITSQRHHLWQHEIIQDLREKYPEIDFIGINIDKDQFQDWKREITSHGYDPEHEFKLNKITVNQVLLKNYLNKLIFLDASGKIIRGDTQISNLNYESSILEFLSEQKIPRKINPETLLSGF